MRVSVYGAGYVGLVTAACLADVGNRVTCVDISADRIAALKRGEIPIYEPGLEDLVEANVRAGRLSFSTNIDDAIDGDIHFIAVGTPQGEDGSSDVSYVLTLARQLGERLRRASVIVTKSTVPVGTSERVRAEIAAALAARGLSLPFEVASNPEFLKEGSAIGDFMRPDRVVIGVADGRAEQLLRTLYQPFSRNHDRLVVMDVVSAEFTKYAANAMLATKISFMNEMASIAERVGADIQDVRIGIGSDPRIGFHFIYAGCGYGGSCFPKDVRALAHSARSHGVPARILDAVDAVNETQKEALGRLVASYFGGDLAGRTVALWGVAFKPNTDDVREAPSRVIVRDLLAAGARVRAYDPKAAESARREFPADEALTFAATAEAAIEGADALVIATEWKEFRSPDYAAIARSMRRPVVFDGRNLYDREVMRAHGFDYFSIGRSPALGYSGGEAGVARAETLPD